MEPEQEAQNLPIAEGPSPWIPLGPAHLLIWIALLWPLVSGAILWPALLSLGLGGETLGWIMSLPAWVIGGASVAVGFKAHEAEAPGMVRRAAFGAAVALWLILMGVGLLLRFKVFGSYGASMNYWRFEPWVALLLALVPMALMLASKEEQSGGSFDAAIAALAILGGLGFVGTLVLAVGALVLGHPMLAVAWESLRRPADALKGEWINGGDDARRAAGLGQMAFTFILIVPLILALLLVEPGRNSFSPSANWARALEAFLTAPLLALATLGLAKRSGHRQGRGLAIATLALFGILLLPVLVGVVVLILWTTHVIR